MSKETTLHFFSGKMAAGKSTLAKSISDENNAILIIEDQWLSQLYPKEITNIPEYLKYSTRLKNLMSDHICSLLSRGISVVVDFPGNTIDQRNWFRNIFERSNVHHTLHFVDSSDAVCKLQLKGRSRDREGEAFTSEEEFDAISKYFQPPSDSEGFNIVRYERNCT